MSVTGASPRRVSLEIDAAKLAAASEILGTRTSAATVDAALSEVIGIDQRRRRIELLCTPGALELADRAVMDSAWCWAAWACEGRTVSALGQRSPGAVSSARMAASSCVWAAGVLALGRRGESGERFRRSVRTRAMIRAADRRTAQSRCASPIPARL